MRVPGSALRVLLALVLIIGIAIEFGQDLYQFWSDIQELSLIQQEIDNATTKIERLELRIKDIKECSPEVIYELSQRCNIDIPGTQLEYVWLENHT